MPEPGSYEVLWQQVLKTEQEKLTWNEQQQLNQRWCYLHLFCPDWRVKWMFSADFHFVISSEG